MCEKLDKISPSTAPHKHYVAFRYVDPLTESTFEQVQKYVLNVNYTKHFVNLFTFLEMVLKELFYFHNILNTVVLPVVQVLMPFIHISKISKLFTNLNNIIILLNMYFVFRKFPENLKMSIIDRWATHPLLIKAIGSRISDEIKKFPESDRDDVVVLFSAHSLPLKVIFFKLF